MHRFRLVYGSSGLTMALRVCCWIGLSRAAFRGGTSSFSELCFSPPAVDILPFAKEVLPGSCALVRSLNGMEPPLRTPATLSESLLVVLAIDTFELLTEMFSLLLSRRSCRESGSSPQLEECLMTVLLNVC